MTSHHSINHAQGFTFIEVLIALVVLSIGLLGLAGLQTLGLRANHSAYLRTQATLLAYDMADRMRTNLDEVHAAGGTYNSVSASAASGTPPSCNAVGSPCTASQIATKDVYQWRTDLGNLLPSGRGKITGDGTTYTITIMWDDLHTGVTGTGCGGNPAVDLTCLSMDFRP